MVSFRCPYALRASAIVELATGCVLLAVPSAVIQALSGSPSDQAGWIVGRVLGGALLALGAAGVVTPSRSPERGVALAFVFYNASTTLILAVAGVAGTADGWLLWPVVAVHGILTVAVALGALGPAPEVPGSAASPSRSAPQPAGRPDGDGTAGDA